MSQWLNHVTIAAPRNGTTTHTVDPSSGTVVAGSAFTPTAGRMLVCIAEAAVTSTTPTGWTLGASAINNTGLYVWYDLSCAGSDTITTTHNASNYPVVFDFYEFPASTTWSGAVGAISVANGGAGPTLSSLTGTNQVYGASGQGTSTGSPGPYTGSWGTGTELVDTSAAYSSTDGYTYGSDEFVDYTGSTASAAWTSTSSAATVERLMWGVSVPGGGGGGPVFGYDAQTVATAYASTGTQTTSHAGSADARAAVVLIDQNASAADQVSGVTYGGTAMTRLGFDTEATEAGGVYIYWLDGVAAGTQSVAMTTTGTANKQLVVATMTAPSGSSVAVAGENTGTSASAANPSWTISGLTAGTKLECFEVIHSGLTSMTTTPAAGWTLISSTDLGAQGRGFARQSVASSGTTCACGWTASTADDFVGSSVSFYEVAGGPVTLAASGTCAAVAATSGNATRVPLTLAASGTADAVSTATGNPTRVGLILAAAATVVVIAATSGAVTRVPLTLAASGTTTITSTTTGNPTRVLLTLAASGTTAATSTVTGDATLVGGAQTLAASGSIAATSTTSGDPTRVPLTLAASGTTTAVTTVTGNPTRVLLTLAASGTTDVVSATSGNPTRVPLTLTASGTIPVIAATSGNPSVVGAPLVAAASGTIPVIAATSGDATRVPLILAVTGQVTVTSTASGDVTRTVLVLAAAGTVIAIATTSGAVTRVSLTLAATGTVPILAATSGDAIRVPLVLAVSGTVDAVTSVTGAVVIVPLYTPDPRRTLLISIESRAVTIPAETRAVLIAAETRLIQVDAETRLLPIPAESRTVEAPCP